MCRWLQLQRAQGVATGIEVLWRRCCFLFSFFFSSRRRHTRFDCDWSSDVCSSDLQSAGDLAADLERWLGGRPIVARPVSPPARIWRWSQRNPKLVGTATAGLLLGAAAVWLFRGELFQASQFNPPDRSIAVLPFTDSSETNDQKFLCDGISDEILHTLGTVDELRVVGRTSSFAFKGKNTNPSEVGQKLNVG